MIRPLTIDLGTGCQCGGNTLEILKGSYVSVPGGVQGRIVSSVLLLDCGCLEYTSRCHQYRSGKAVKNLNRTGNKGYVAKRFIWNDYLDDIHEINMSKAVRCGGPMRDGYKVPAEKLKKSIPDWKCPRHWAIPWGVFDKDGRLRAYVVMVRAGDIALYSQILGHGDYMKDDIMPFIHFKIRQWIDTSPDCEGLTALMYGGHYDGMGKGLQNWKERLLFEPTRLEAAL